MRGYATAGVSTVRGVTLTGDTHYKSAEDFMEKDIYSGKIFEITQRTVSLPNGKSALRDIVHMRGAAAVLPLTDDGRILFVRQFRAAAQINMLEIPAGMIDPGEEPLQCAVRELEEETGYKATGMEFMLRFHPGAGYNTEVLHLYLAKGLTPGTRHLDEDEFVTVEAYDLATALRWIDEGVITDAKTIIALLFYTRTQGL